MRNKFTLLAILLAFQLNAQVENPFDEAFAESDAFFITNQYDKTSDYAAAFDTLITKVEYRSDSLLVYQEIKLGGYGSGCWAPNCQQAHDHDGILRLREVYLAKEGRIKLVAVQKARPVQVKKTVLAKRWIYE